MNRLALSACSALAALALLLTGCSAEGEETVTDPREPAGSGNGPTLPQGADDVVLRIETGGGYVPVDYAFAGGPILLVTGDGTVLQPAPQAADAGVPRLLTYVQHTVDEATLDELGRLADGAGLLAEPPDYDAEAPQVTDMPSTTVTVTADGETWTHSAYALGFEQEQGARADLADFVDDAVELLDDGDVTPYRPTAVRLMAAEAGGGAEATTTAWPVAAVDLATAASCTVVDEPAAVAAVVAALERTERDASFTQAGRTWSVTAAAVLPGDVRPCADW